MASYYIIVDGDKITIIAIAAFAFRLSADAGNPFVSAAGLITALAGFYAFKPFCEDIFSSCKQGSKQSNLFLFRGVVCDCRGLFWLKSVGAVLFRKKSFLLLKLGKFALECGTLFVDFKKFLFSISD
jgi:hypothetical protein